MIALVYLISVKVIWYIIKLTLTKSENFTKIQPSSLVHQKDKNWKYTSYKNVGCTETSRFL